MNKRLEEIISCIPLFKTMSRSDAAICVWNEDAVVEAFYKSNSIAIEFQVGYKVEDKNDKIYEVLRTGVQAYNKVPKEAFGAAFEGTITPIKDGNKIVGVITFCVSTEEKNSIADHTLKLTSSLTHTDERIEGIKHGTTQLAANMTKVQEITELVREQAVNAVHIVESIQNNAKYSNILALNASIESARAGQAGKGFAVVSDEMRKFSKQSGDAAQDINMNLTQIMTSIDEVRDAIHNSASIAEEQADAANHLHEMFDQVVTTANTVNEICNNKSAL